LGVSCEKRTFAAICTEVGSEDKLSVNANKLDGGFGAVLRIDTDGTAYSHEYFAFQ